MQHFFCRNTILPPISCPEPAFPALSREYGVCDVARFQKRPKMESCDIYGHRTCQSGRRHATMARKTRPRLHPFHLFDVPALPIRNKNQESRKRQHSDRNNSHPDMRRGHRKSLHTQTENVKATSQIYDVARLKNTSKHPFLLSRRNQQRLKHNEPTHRFPPRCRPKASTTIKFRNLTFLTYLS